MPSKSRLQMHSVALELRRSNARRSWAFPVIRFISFAKALAAHCIIRLLQTIVFSSVFRSFLLHAAHPHISHLFPNAVGLTRYSLCPLRCLILHHTVSPSTIRDPRSLFVSRCKGAWPVEQGWRGGAASLPAAAARPVSSPASAADATAILVRLAHFVALQPTLAPGFLRDATSAVCSRTSGDVLLDTKT